MAALADRAAHGRRPLRIRVFGRIDALPTQLAETARRVQAQTADNDGLVLNVALGYSGRDELVDATRKLVASLAADAIPAAEIATHIDAAAIERHLYTADHSDPDLIVRTSAEMRLSGFLPWQSSHSEFYFTGVYWPAFRELDFLRAVRTYQQRERRFGRSANMNASRRSPHERSHAERLASRDGYFAPESIIRRVGSTPVTPFLGGGTAVLLQVAHPLVAAGVTEHSDFRHECGQRGMNRKRLN